MIRYEWRSDVSEPEATQIRALLEAAAEYDREPEFSSIEFGDVEDDLARSGSDRGLLLIWMLPRQTKVGEADEPESLAGVLRMVLDSHGVGDVQLVIRPELRSIGIVTLFVERAGLDVAADGGWLGSGAISLRAWAQGNHPAAGRLSDRHLIPRTKRVWKLIRPVELPSDPALPTSRVRVLADGSETVVAESLTDFSGRVADSPVPCSTLLRDLDHTGKTVLVAIDSSERVVGALTLTGEHPVVSDEFGKCAVAEYVSRDPADDDPALTRALLVSAVEHVADIGFEGLVVYVDSENAPLVNACRLTGFQHDRTDVRFQL